MFIHFYKQNFLFSPFFSSFNFFFFYFPLVFSFSYFQFFFSLVLVFFSYSEITIASFFSTHSSFAWHFLSFVYPLFSYIFIIVTLLSFCIVYLDFPLLGLLTILFYKFPWFLLYIPSFPVRASCLQFLSIYFLLHFYHL